MRLVSCFPAELISFCGSAGKESACSARDLGLIPGLGRSPGEGKGYPLQHCGLENSMDYIVHGVTKSQTGPRDFPCHFLCESPLYIGNHKWLFLFSITLSFCNLEILFSHYLLGIFYSKFPV